MYDAQTSYVSDTCSCGGKWTTFKGCHSYGNTIDEAISNIREVIELCLEDTKSSDITNQFIGFRALELEIA